MTIVDASPIACTLAPGAFKDRLAWIAALNKDALDTSVAISYWN